MADIAIPTDLEQAANAINNRLSGYRTYRDYYTGDHELSYSTAKFQNAFGAYFRTFSDNLMGTVVDAVADRLVIEGFGVEEGEDIDVELAWQIWKANRMQRRSGEGHLEALKTGDAYILVWENPEQPERPKIWVEKADLWTIKYDSETPGLVLWAAKLWQAADKHVRINLYYPDRIEKYVSLKGTSTIFLSVNEYELMEEPMPNPYGVVPVFHMANNASAGELGQSELANVIPIQNALNKALMDQFVAQEFVALPQRWATGLQVEIDPTTGKPATNPFAPGAESLWVASSENVTFGQFPAADLTQFLNTQNSLRAEIARISGTPMHHMFLNTGDFPSGEALKTAEARFLSKVRDRMMAFGEVWADVMSFALRLAGRPDVRLTVDWRDPEPRSELDHVNAVAIKVEKLSIPKTQAWRELGYSEEEIDHMLADEADLEARSLQTRATAIRAEQAAILGETPTTNATLVAREDTSDGNQ